MVVSKYTGILIVWEKLSWLFSFTDVDNSSSVNLQDSEIPAESFSFTVFIPFSIFQLFWFHHTYVHFWTLKFLSDFIRSIGSFADGAHKLSRCAVGLKPQSWGHMDVKSCQQCIKQYQQHRLITEFISCNI